MAHIPRIYVPGRLGPGPLLLGGDEARRLTSVMRIREGDEFRGFSGDGREAPPLPREGRRALAIGPEGGFSDEEVALAQAHGALAASFGPNTFRTETAAV